MTLGMARLGYIACPQKTHLGHRVHCDTIYVFCHLFRIQIHLLDPHAYTDGGIGIRYDGGIRTRYPGHIANGIELPGRQ